jgi:branched-chain amino acid transport system substrate-binding protein
LAVANIYCRKLVNIALVSRTFETQNTNCPGFNFHLVPNDRVEAQALSQYMLKKMHRRKAVAIFASGALRSESLKTEFRNALERDGGEVVHEFDMASKNFSASLRERKDLLKRAEVVVLFPNKKMMRDGLDNKLVEVLKLQRDLQHLALLSSSSHLDYKLLQIVIRNKGYGTGMVMAKPCCSTISKADNWQSILTQDAIQILATALESQPTREGIRKSLSAHDFQAKGESGQIRFEPSGDRNIPIQFVQIMHNPNASKSDAQYNFVPVK